MKKVLLIMACLILAGCSQEAVWVERIIPTTDAERKAIADHTEKILGHVPSTLSGHDRDWDDAIKEAHRQAEIMFCRPTYWERKDVGGCNWDYTGKFRYADDPKEKADDKELSQRRDADLKQAAYRKRAIAYFTIHPEELEEYEYQFDVAFRKNREMIMPEAWVESKIVTMLTNVIIIENIKPE